MSDADKVTYLRSAIKGRDGIAILEAETGSGDDYDELVSILKLRFDKKRLVHRTHLMNLLQHRVSSYSLEEMQRTQTLWKKHIMGLQKEGQLKAESLLTSIAELSLDEETYKEWCIYSNEYTVKTGW